MSFKRSAALLASAAALIAAQFGLFGKVLENLAPPIANVDVKVGVASFACVMILLLIALLSRNAGHKADVAFVVVAIVLFIVAAGLYWKYENVEAEYIYRYPPEAHYSAGRYIRGELHESGRALVRDQSIGYAVADLGGVDFVVGQQILWTERSQQDVELRLLALYLAIVVTSGGALYCLIVRLVRKPSTPKAKPKPKPKPKPKSD